MSLQISTILNSTCEQMLGSLIVILDKAKAHAAAKKIDEAVMLGYRLAPDMFPLARQVQIASDSVVRGAARLAGAEVPSTPDKEASFDELKARVAKALDYVRAQDKAAIDAASGRDITFPVGQDKTMTMNGGAYLTGWVFPNFYFHVTAAYALIRHCGVEVGKRDYLGAH